MKRKGLLKRVVFISLIVVLAVGLPLMSGCMPEAAPPVTPPVTPPVEPPVTPPVEPPEEVEPIYIGFVGPLSGPYTHAGEGKREGVELAVKEINEAGGVLGREVIVIIRDSKFMVEADPTAAYCKEFIDKYNVAFVCGGYSDTTGQTVQANTVWRGVPFLSLVSANPVATRGDEIHPYKFTFQVNTDEMAFMYVPYLMVNNLVDKKWFLIGPDYEWGWGINIGVENAVLQYGGEVIKTVHTPLPTLDMAPYIAEFERLLPGGEGTIFNCSGGTEDAAFIQAVHDARLIEKGYDVVDIPIDTAIYHYALADPDLWKGIYTADYSWYGEPEGREFVMKYYNEYGKFPGEMTGCVSYFQTTWALKAIEATGTLDAEVWTEWLRGRHLTGVIDTKDKYYDSVNGRLVQQMDTYIFKQPEDMVDIFPELPEIGAEWDHLGLLHVNTTEYMAALTTDEDEIAGIPNGDYRIGAGVRAYWEAYCEEHGLEMPPNLRGTAPLIYGGD